MIPTEISRVIEKEINGDWSISNMHGCDLRKCLVRPKKRKIMFGDRLRDAWIVLEENPETLEGFKVFYDEETCKFGLAGHSEQYSYVCNLHNTFLEAFESI